eukprot:3029758-Amphidinium_carterae.2
MTPGRTASTCSGFPRKGLELPFEPKNAHVAPVVTAPGHGASDHGSPKVGVSSKPSSRPCEVFPATTKLAYQERTWDSWSWDKARSLSKTIGFAPCCSLDSSDSVVQPRTTSTLCAQVLPRTTPLSPAPPQVPLGQKGAQRLLAPQTDTADQSLSTALVK